METKRIKCPSCGVLLDVRNSQNEAVKMITCPQCKAQLKVNFSLKQQYASSPLVGETQYVNPNAGETQYVNRDNGETRYIGQTSSENPDETILSGKKAVSIPGYLSFGGQKYPLELGNNVIGRKASTSQATVQIATDDRYMSRQHLHINVIKVSAEKVRVIVSNEHNKNATYINGQLLNEGDQLILTDGSTIKMGNTIVVYHQK